MAPERTETFISNASFAGLFTVFAQAREADERPSISAFLVEAGTNGMTFGRPRTQDGSARCSHLRRHLRGTVYVADDALLGGKLGIGLDGRDEGLDRGRLFIAACCVGLAYRLIENAADYANGRVQFGVPSRAITDPSAIGGFPDRGLCRPRMVENAARKSRAGRAISCEA